MPEALLGVIGLADDAGVLALVLMWLKGVTSVDAQVLRDNWSGRDDVITVIDRLNAKISANADRLFSDKVWRKLRKRFAKGERAAFFAAARASRQRGICEMRSSNYMKFMKNSRLFLITYRIL